MTIYMISMIIKHTAQSLWYYLPGKTQEKHSLCKAVRIIFIMTAGGKEEGDLGAECCEYTNAESANNFETLNIYNDKKASGLVQ